MYKAAEENGTYILENTEKKMKAIFLPHKGGMLYGLEVMGESCLYQDENNIASEERPKCGMPILFPICGRLKDDTLKRNEINSEMSIHGFAHTNPWVVETLCETKEYAQITMSFEANEKSLKMYPFLFRLEYTYLLSDRKITIKQKIINLGKEDMPFSFGFHPYFNMQECYEGILKINASDAYSLNEKKMHKVNAPYKIQRGSIDKSEMGEMFFGVKSPVIWENLTSKKNIKISFTGDFKVFVLWLPKEKNCICLEPWEDAPNALNMGKGLLIKALQTKSSEIEIEIGE